jgi:hypothetical protein
MQALYNRDLYGKTTALKIEVMGRNAVAIANRWALGWPTTVMELLVDGRYLEVLGEQHERELDVICDTYMPHLSETEILQMQGVSLSPPVAC